MPRPDGHGRRHVRALVHIAHKDHDGGMADVDPDDEMGPSSGRINVDGPAKFVSSNHYLWERTKAQGLPRWAAWAVGVAVGLGAVGGAVVYLSSHSLLAAAVVLGVFWLMGLVVLNFADMAQRKR
jgi:hypothetical protein